MVDIQFTPVNMQQSVNIARNREKAINRVSCKMFETQCPVGVAGVCYGDAGSEVETDGSGRLHCRVGSLFTGRSSFQPGEARDGPAGGPSGPFVIWLSFPFALLFESFAFYPEPL